MKYFAIILFILTSLIFYHGTTKIQLEKTNLSKNLAHVASLRISREREENKRVEFANRVKRVHNFLGKYQSPLANYSMDFVRVSDRFGFDYRLLPAIAGKESTFCKFHIPGTYNCWGWGRGLIRFTSFTNAIERIGKGLASSYQTNNLRLIAYKYAPPFENNTEKWIYDVRSFMNEIE